MAKDYDIYAFAGGVDQNTPYLSRTPGSLIAASNYEPDPDGGYRYMTGYERFDGNHSPTDATITVINVDSVYTTEPALGANVQGGTSGVTGNYIGQSSELNHIYVTNASGIYQDNETITGGLTVDGDSLPASSAIIDSERLRLFRIAREYNRSQIQEVPGSGPVRFVYELDGIVYAIRDNSGATAANIYRSSPSGWQLVDISANKLVRFDTGQAGSVDPFVIGDTVTGATSGATGVVTGSSNQASDRQAGYITLKTVTGTFQDNEELQVGGNARASVNGAQEDIALNAGGQYKATSYNFFGFDSTNSIYFTNGTQTAFQFDGEALAPIESPTERGNPKLITVHHDHLFLAFDNGILIHSVIGEPLSFRGDLGAVEFALGAEITNLIESPISLVMTTIANVQVLYGQNRANWEKGLISTKSIGLPNTGQYLLQPLTVDRSGLISLVKVERFGNYQDATISDNVRPLFNRLADTITTSSINKARNHYYMFTSSGENLIAAFSNNAFIGYYPFNLGRTVIYSDSNEERSFFTSEEGGFVYEWQKGTSHDGEEIEAFIQTSYAYQGRPQIKKRYRRATLSLKTFLAVTVNIAFSFSKGSPTIQNTDFSGLALGGGGRWDVGRWNEILWDGQDVPELISDISGVGTDISMFVYSRSAEQASFTIEDITLEYSLRASRR